MCYPDDQGRSGWRQHARLDEPEAGPSPGLATSMRPMDEEEEGICGAAVRREEPRSLIDSGALRLKAVDRLHELGHAIDARVDAEAIWLSLNWTEFIGRTQSNPAFAYPKASYTSVVGRAAKQPSVGGMVVGGVLDSARSVAIGSGVEGVAKTVGDSFGTKLSKSIARGVGKAIPLLIDLVWGIIDEYQMNQRVDRLLHDNSVSQAGRAAKKLKAFYTEAEAKKEEERAVRREIRQSLDAMKTHEDFTAFEGWIDGRFGELPPLRNTDDLSLFDDMLAHWVLQHTGDVDEPNAETGQADYDEAKKHAKNSSSASATLEQGKTALYLHQLRYALASHGLSSTPVERLVPRPPPGRYRLDGVKVASPSVFANAMTRRHRRSPDGSPRVPNYLAAAQRDEVVMHCDFECDMVDGRPVLERVEFVATCVGKSREAWDRGMTLDKKGADGRHDRVSGGFGVLEWEYEPT